jgi:hypothetical protein
MTFFTKSGATVSILLLSILILVGVATASAQDLVGGASRTDLSGGDGRTTRRPKVRNTAASTGVRTVARAKTVILTPTTGTLSVAAESGASLLVEPLRGGEAQEGDIEKDERQFIFNKLAPGRYRVAAELDGYTADEKEVIVVANKTIPVSLNLLPKPSTYTVTLTVNNVQTGEVRYTPVIAVKDTVTGLVKYDVNGDNTRVTQLQNGRAVLSNLRAGTYGVDVRASEVGYQTLLATFTLPGKTDYNVTLPKLLSTYAFSATWVSLDSWEAPVNWRIDSQKLIVEGAGIALPKDEAYRHYSDFQLSSDVKMLNEVAASFVVRFVDRRNYYLIQITGAKADQPYVLRGFVIKNGVSQSLDAPIPIGSFAISLKANQWFNVLLRMIGNKISVSINDSQTGELIPLGILLDNNQNFPIGAVGIGGRDSERNEIGRFIICTPDCGNQ